MDKTTTAFSFKLKKKEVEANHFAVNLLAPREMVEEELRKADYFENKEVDIMPLAGKFGISGEAMTYALIVHGFK